MKATTAIRPPMPAVVLLETESWPSVASTDWTCATVNGTGSAPAFRNSARVWASCAVNLPRMIASPSRIGSSIVGALRILSSRTMARISPTFRLVKSANFFLPSLVNFSETTVR